VVRAGSAKHPALAQFHGFTRNRQPAQHLRADEYCPALLHQRKHGRMRRGSCVVAAGAARQAGAHQHRAGINFVPGSGYFFFPLDLAAARSSEAPVWSAKDGFSE